MKEKSNLLVFFLILVIVFTISSLLYSKYLVKNELGVRVIDQASECFSDQAFDSKAKWSQGNIIMETTFETPDPCYRIDSIRAFQQGDRIEINIRMKPGGVCIQCFGFQRIEYEILSPGIENDMEIYVNVEEMTRHYVWLPLLV